MKTTTASIKSDKPKVKHSKPKNCLSYFANLPKSSLIHSPISAVDLVREDRGVYFEEDLAVPNPDPAIAELSKIFARLTTAPDVFNFLYDVATPQEIETLAQRFQIAKLLWTTSLSYLEIANKVGTSTTTVTRVARFLNQEPFGGYRQVLSTRYPKADQTKKKRIKT